MIGRNNDENFESDGEQVVKEKIIEEDDMFADME